MMIKKKFILLFMVFLLIIIPLVSADCYNYSYVEEEYSVSYNADWDPVLIANFTFDGNHSTYGQAKPYTGSLVRAIVYHNFSYNESFSGGLLSFHDGTGYYNISVPSECYNGSFVRLRTESNSDTGLFPSYINFQCFANDGTLSDLRSDAATKQLYDIGIFWNVTVPCSSSTSLVDEASGFSNSFITFGVILLLLLGFVVSKKEYSKYAVYVLLFGGGSFGLWFLLSVI